MDSQPPQVDSVSYVCGDCGQENTLKTGDVIQCRECGYRILYKKRTRRMYALSKRLACDGRYPSQAEDLSQ